jgi:hypothetical protein
MCVGAVCFLLAGVPKLEDGSAINFIGEKGEDLDDTVVVARG